MQPKKPTMPNLRHRSSSPGNQGGVIGWLAVILGVYWVWYAGLAKATAGDGKVILSWDDLSDKRTHEPFLQNVNDFEGYKLYRATDKVFSDAEVITTGQGDKHAKRPIFQCDLNNKITGYADYGYVEGTAFYLGNDTGIKHYYIDEDV